MSSKYLVCCLLFIISFGSNACGGGEGENQHSLAITPVVAYKAVRESVSDEISVVGTLGADEVVEIQSEIDGIVEEVAFREGQAVKQGELLFKIDEQKLSTMLAEAEANYQLALANLKRSEELFKKSTISSREYDQTKYAFQAAKATAERARQNLEDAKVLAPFDGEMGERLISTGQLVAKGQTLSSIVKYDTIKLEFNVPERFSDRLVSGLAVRAEVEAYPDRGFVGRVFFVSPQVDSNTRTILVKARIPNADFRLKPGMLARVAAVFEVREGAVVIPESALMVHKDSVLVYVIGDKDVVALRPVTIGKRLEGRVEITSGVSQGELVIVEGVQKIGPGSQVSFKLVEDKYTKE